MSAIIEMETVTADFNAILVGALYQHVKQSLGLNE